MSNLQENSFFSNPGEKQTFESDDIKIIEAFYYSFLGAIGFLHAAKNPGKIKNYFRTDKQLRLTTIGDDNNDVSVIIKTMSDKGFFRSPNTANEITKFLVKARSGQIDEVDENVVRGWLDNIKKDKKLAAPKILKKRIDAFEASDMSLGELAYEMRDIAKYRKWTDSEFFQLTRGVRLDADKLKKPNKLAAPTPTPAQTPPVTPTPVSQQPVSTQTAPIQQPVVAPSRNPQQSTQSTQTVDILDQEKIIEKLSDYRKVAEFLNDYVTDDEKLESVYNAGLTNPKVLFLPLLIVRNTRTPIVQKLTDRVHNFLLKMDFGEIIDNLPTGTASNVLVGDLFKNFFEKVVSTKKEDAAEIFAEGSTKSKAIYKSSIQASSIYKSYEGMLMDLYKDFKIEVAPPGFVTDGKFLKLVPDSVMMKIKSSDDKVMAAFNVVDNKSYYNEWDVKEFKDAIGDDPKDLEIFEKDISMGSTGAFLSYIGTNSNVDWILESQLRVVENATPRYLITNFFMNYYTSNNLIADPRVLSAILKKTIQYLENAGLFDKKANDIIYMVLTKVESASLSLTKAESESLEDAIRPSMRKIVLKHIQEYLRVGAQNYDSYKGLSGLSSARHAKIQNSRYFKYLNAEDISGFVDMYIENPNAHESIPLPNFGELSDRQKSVIFRNVFNSYNNEVYPEDSEPYLRAHQLYDEEFVEALRVSNLETLSPYQKAYFVDTVAPSDNIIEAMQPDEAKKAYQTKTKFYSKLFGSMDKDDQILFANNNIYGNIRNLRSIISSEEVLDETLDAMVQKFLVKSIPEIGKTRNNADYGLSALAGTLKDVSYQDETPERVYRVFEGVVRGIEERKLSKNSKVYREVFADIETSALLYAETKRDEFEEFYKSLGTGMKNQISRSYIEAKGSATTVKAALHDESALIKPYQKLDNASIRKALKYNNLSVSNINIPASATKDLASMEAFADSFSEGVIEKQHIAEVETPKAELDRLSADLHRKNRTNRHGRNSLKVLRVLNVAVPKQVEGQKVWDEEHPGQEKIDPMFHGTNAVAAAMITRYGFSVGKNAVNGRMLGDGIYGSNAIDKAQLYVGDKYGKGSTGVRGYIFVMDASLGKRNEDYKAAGLPDSQDDIRSPEWCVFTPNSQFRIYKAYEVEIVSKEDIDKILEDNPLVQYNESTRPIRFSKFLREYSMDKVEYPDVMTFTFMNGNIPVKGPDGKPTYVDFEDFKPTNKNVSLEPSAYGPTVVITDTEESEDYRFKSPTDLLMQDEELFNKFLELTS